MEWDRENAEVDNRGAGTQSGIHTARAAAARQSQPRRAEGEYKPDPAEHREPEIPLPDCRLIQITTGVNVVPLTLKELPAEHTPWNAADVFPKPEHDDHRQNKEDDHGGAAQERMETHRIGCLFHF